MAGKQFQTQPVPMTLNPDYNNEVSPIQQGWAIFVRNLVCLREWCLSSTSSSRERMRRAISRLSFGMYCTVLLFYHLRSKDTGCERVFEVSVLCSLLGHACANGCAALPDAGTRTRTLTTSLESSVCRSRRSSKIRRLNLSALLSSESLRNLCCFARASCVRYPRCV